MKAKWRAQQKRVVRTMTRAFTPVASQVSLSRASRVLHVAYNGTMRMHRIPCLAALGLAALTLGGCFSGSSRALVDAAGNGDVNLIESLCAKGVDPNQLVDGYTALTMAVEKGHTRDSARLP